MKRGWNPFTWGVFEWMLFAFFAGAYTIIVCCLLVFLINHGVIK